MIEIEATNRTTVLVCVTCWIPNDVPNAPLAGLMLDARNSKICAPAIVVIGDIVHHRQLSVAQENPCARS